MSVAVALPTKKKWVLIIGVLGLLLVATAGVLLFLLTEPVEIPFTQEPNKVEAHEANRKLKLLAEAHAAKRKGFVRLTEVEINSLLDGRHPLPWQNSSAKPAVPAGASELLRSAVHLSASNITLITWHHAPLLTFEFPFVWQRSFEVRHQLDGVAFTLEEMRLGRIGIPRQFWPRVNALLGEGDQNLAGGQAWLASLPRVMLARNEITHAPEIRLYSVLPDDKVKP